MYTGDLNLQQPKIDVRVPHEPGGMVGADCNRILKESPHPWVLIFDSDVFLKTHPNWYWISQQAINKYPDVMLFSATCNNIGCKDQLDKEAPEGHDLSKHISYARTIYERHGLLAVEPRSILSGFWLLINREAAISVGAFPGEGQFKEDNIFHKRMKARYPVRVLKGLYFYHERDRKHGSFIEDDVTACELAGKKKRA